MTDAAPTETLRSGKTTATVHPAAGGRVGQIMVAGQPLLVDVPERPDDAHPMLWGSFAMAPWVGRVRRGHFRFDGADHQLPINHRDGEGPERGHAIHGLVFDREFTTTSATANSWSGTIDMEWEFGGTATQTVAVFDDRIVSTLEVAAAVGPFPAEVGWHPWFRKPDRLDFSPSTMYERDEFGLPTGNLVEPSDGPWDDCFLNTEPIILRYDRTTAPAITVTSDCSHVVVYDSPDDATCIEPQSGPPDAFNLHPNVAAPSLARTLVISW